MLSITLAISGQWPPKTHAVLNGTHICIEIFEQHKTNQNQLLFEYARKVVSPKLPELIVEIPIKIKQFILNNPVVKSRETEVLFCVL